MIKSFMHFDRNLILKCTMEKILLKETKSTSLISTFEG